MNNNIIKPTLTVLIGLPASGKSTYAKSIKQLDSNENTVILSSDDIREKLLGDRTNQEENQKVFNHLYLQMKSYLLTFNDVIIDATNISRKSRRGIFDKLKNIPCYIKAIVLATPYEECLKRNRIRENKIPEYVIERMYHSFQLPQKFEGFDEIKVIPFLDRVSAIGSLLELEKKTVDYQQNNFYHSLPLDRHLYKCFTNVKAYNGDEVLEYAGLFHDIGKPLTMEVNKETGYSTYYGHENVGAYEFTCAFYGINEYLWNNKWDNNTLCEFIWLINSHMLPYTWKEQKTLDKYKKLFGEKLFNNLMLLHEADKKAH